MPRTTKSYLDYERLARASDVSMQGESAVMTPAINATPRRTSARRE